jgi:tRNA-specific 2-thiouridylase
VAAAEPLYVVKLDAKRREVVVGPRHCLRTRHISLRDVNWLGDERLEDLAGHGKDILARIRSSGPLQQATLRVDARRIEVELSHGEDGVSPGQACVLYAADERGERLLGGGWIKSAEGPEIIRGRSRAKQTVAGPEPLAASPR